MQKTNIRDKISQRRYFLARLSRQCLQVHVEHSGQLQISYLASMYHVLFAAVGTTYYTEATNNRDMASQLSTYSVYSSKGKIARQLDKASMLARQIAHNTASRTPIQLGTQLEQLTRYVAPSLVTFSQLAIQLPNLAWLFLGGLSRSKSS